MSTYSGSYYSCCFLNSLTEVASATEIEMNETLKLEEANHVSLKNF